MKILLTSDDQSIVYDTLTVDPSTLITTDSIGTPVVLFPRPGERDMTTLVDIVREALSDEAKGHHEIPADYTSDLLTFDHVDGYVSTDTQYFYGSEGQA